MRGSIGVASTGASLNGSGKLGAIAPTGTPSEHCQRQSVRAPPISPPRASHHAHIPQNMHPRGPSSGPARHGTTASCASA
eukprot:7305757-Prymnesium_polylepis.1